MWHYLQIVFGVAVLVTLFLHSVSSAVIVTSTFCFRILTIRSSRVDVSDVRVLYEPVSILCPGFLKANEFGYVVLVVVLF